MTDLDNIIFDYEASKAEYHSTCRAMIAKAVELGCDPKSAEDARVSLAFLKGYRRDK